MPVRPTLLHRMALVSFLLFRKNLGNLREFFGQIVYRPPWQKISRTPMIPTVDEINQSISGSKVFCKLDLKWGYRQLELCPESREITTFATHCGLFRYKRLLFDVNSASEQYQYEIQTALAGIEGQENISDDIIVHAKDQKEHDLRL